MGIQRITGHTFFEVGTRFNEIFRLVAPITTNILFQIFHFFRIKYDEVIALHRRAAARRDFYVDNGFGASAVTIDAANDRLYLGFGQQAFVLNDASKLTNSSGAAQAVAIMGPPNTAISYFAVGQ